MKTVDLTNAPSTDFLTKTLFWSHYTMRHFVGPKYGYYGPKWALPILKHCERKTLQDSKTTGELPVRDVPRYRPEELTPEKFQQFFLKPNTPVVIEGLAKNWDAVKDWSAEFFSERYGDYNIPVRMIGDKLDETALKIVDMKLNKLVENINAGGKFYGANMADIFNDNKELREALDLNILTKYMISNKRAKIGSTQLFFSGGGTRSGFHCTGGINLFVMVAGHKEWTFVPPKYTMWMQPITRKDLFYSATPFDWKKPFDEIDAEGYPLYRYAPKFVANLYAGDVLFSPQWWWHAVNTSCTSLAVAVRAINKIVLGNVPYSFLWATSKEFRALVFEIMKTGWGSDKRSGARLAFEQEFVDKTTH
ncbi:MAG: cupin-like domain-containing protein [Deltaproteobacteria bacterium]|nr:cupin-like domain-containing protein [Deltaproteobacteria bacterium]